MVLRNSSVFPSSRGGEKNGLSERAVIRELKLQPDVRPLEQLNRFLEQIPALPAHPHEVALDRGLDLDLAVLDLFHDLFELLDGYARLKRDLCPCFERCDRWQSTAVEGQHS